MSRKHPDDHERSLPNRRRELIRLVEASEPYTDDPYEAEWYDEYMRELDEVEREMHIHPRKRYGNRDQTAPIIIRTKKENNWH